MKTWTILLLGCFFSCTPSPPTLTVGAAASLRNLLSDLKGRFEAQNKLELNFSFSASGILRSQIEQGAPFDLFISASAHEMAALETSGKIQAQTRQTFALNRLVMVAAQKAAPCQAPPQAFFAHTKLKRLAIGQPQNVPAGLYAQEALRFYKQWTALEESLIYTSHVRQALDYALRQEVDYSIVYQSDYQTFQTELQRCFVFPQESHQPIRFQLAQIKGASPETTRLQAFLLAPEQDDLLTAYGFRRP